MIKAPTPFEVSVLACLVTVAVNAASPASKEWVKDPTDMVRDAVNLYQESESELYKRGLLLDG